MNHIKAKTGTWCELRQTTAAKDLGVILDENLNFSKHIDDIVCDANRLVGLL